MDELHKNILKQALLFLNENNFRKSYELFLKLNVIYPNKTEILNYMAMIKSRMGENKKSKILFLKVLELQPNNFEACKNLSIINFNLKEYETALTYINKVIRKFPTQKDFLFIKANILKAMEKYDLSEKTYKNIIKIDDKFIPGLFNLAKLYLDQNKFNDAKIIFSRILNIEKDNYKSMLYIGICELNTKNYHSAINILENAKCNLNEDKDVFYALGISYFEIKKYDLSIINFKKCIKIQKTFDFFYQIHRAYLKKGDLQNAINNLLCCNNFETKNFNIIQEIALLYFKSKDYKNSRKFFKKAIELRPNESYCHDAIALCLQYELNFKLALKSHDKAIIIKSNDPKFYNNRGTTYRLMGKYINAIRDYNKAIRLNNDFAEAFCGKAFIYLLHFKYKKGLKYFEYRNYTNKALINRPDFKSKFWDGDLNKLKNKSILIYSEQGLGDVIQHSRYIQLIQSFPIKIILVVPDVLLGLLNSFSSNVIIISEKFKQPKHDYHLPIMSLNYFTFNLQNNKSIKLPYILNSNKEKYRFLFKNNYLKVGICWKGNPNHEEDKSRSLNLSYFSKLITKEIQFYSLQKEVTKKESDFLKSKKVNLIQDNFSNFVETSNHIVHLDLIITVDTSIAHLSGAMGKKVWLLVNDPPDYRWGLKTSKTSLYKNMKIYRKSGSWEKLIKDIKNDLFKLI